MEQFVVVVTLPGTNEHFTRDCSGIVTIGRSDENAICLSHPLVSRHHAEVAFNTPEGFVVRDLASRNGTVANGARLQDEAAVFPGEVTVQAGPYILSFSRSREDSDATVVAVVDHLRTSRLGLDRGKHALIVDGTVAVEKLSRLEWKLVEELTKRAPDLMPNSALGDAIWGKDLWDSYMLHNLVRRVRRKLEDRGLDADALVVSVPGVGYRVG